MTSEPAPSNVQLGRAIIVLSTVASLAAAVALFLTDSITGLVLAVVAAFLGVLGVALDDRKGWARAGLALSIAGCGLAFGLVIANL